MSACAFPRAVGSLEVSRSARAQRPPLKKQLGGEFRLSSASDARLACARQAETSRRGDCAIARAEPKSSGGVPPEDKAPLDPLSEQPQGGAGEEQAQGQGESGDARPAAFVKAEQASQQPASLTLDDINPYGLGRRSRQFLDDVWQRLLDLGQLARPAPLEESQEDLIQGPNCEFEIPNAQFTKLLVVGATGRVGRILVRKLLLRGYTVRVVVRKKDAPTMEALPSSVEVVEVDFERSPGEAQLKAAVAGCQKIIFCAAATDPTPAKLQAVDTHGVVKLAKAMLDYNHNLAQRRAGRSRKSKAVVVKFNKERYQSGWKLREGRVNLSGMGPSAGADSDSTAPALGSEAEFEITETGNGLFEGIVVERGSYVEVKRVVEMPDGLSLGRFEGLVLRVVGDGRQYSLVLETEVPHYQAGLAADVTSEAADVGSSRGRDSDDSAWNGTSEWALAEDEDELELTGKKPKPPTNGSVRSEGQPHRYIARFNTRRGPSTIRIPFSVFQPVALGQPPLDPGNVTSLALRFEQRRPKARPPVGLGAGVGAPAPGTDPYSFRLEVDFIKAFPGGDETDFILVSCTGAAVPEDAREAVVKAKMVAESQLRVSGLGYTIVRPGPLIEEPGGRKALVFDQGNRISQGISCADVADVCVKALHDPLARNKSFDICYEYTEGSGLYELVAHLPDKANNYLTPALALLEKNT